MLIVKQEGGWQISYHTTSDPQPGPDSSIERTAAVAENTSDLPIAPPDAEQQDGCRG
jgi:hypothetical protein